MGDLHIRNVGELAEAVGADLMRRMTAALPVHLIAAVMVNPAFLVQGIDEGVAAEFIGVKVSTLQAWRCRGGGPKFIRGSGRLIKYRRIELLEYQQDHLVSSTIEVPPSADCAHEQFTVDQR